MGSEKRGCQPARLRELTGQEYGAAPVDFALTAALVILLMLGLLQLTLTLHVRNVLTDAAGEGARRVALVGGTEAEAAARVHALSDAALSDGYVDSVRVTEQEYDGVPIVEVTVEAPLPLLGFVGPEGSLSVRGRAVDEAYLIRDGDR